MCLREQTILPTDHGLTSYIAGYFSDDFSGSGRVTGSFNYSGSSVINDIDAAFTVLTGSGTVGTCWTLTNGYYNTNTDTLYFGVTSGGCPAGGNPTFTSLNLSHIGRRNSPRESVGFDPSTDALVITSIQATPQFQFLVLLDVGISHSTEASFAKFPRHFQPWRCFPWLA
jgi:hypothetical protein